MKKIFVVIIFLTCADVLFAQLRNFNDIFPSINNDIRNAAFGNSGYVRSSQKTSGFALIGAQRTSAIDPQIINNVLNRNPLYLVESILVIPGKNDNVNLLDVYNALGNIRGLIGRPYNSYSKNREVPLFEDATRIAGEKQTTAIPDPPPARILPRSETVYIRLKDANFGNTFYCAEMAVIQNGLRYTLSNFKNISYLFVPVIREEKFIAQLYIEPIEEGVLIYSIAGTDISDFIASRINVDSAISKRLAVITSWAADGISAKRNNY
jgi:hypothetical protein